MELINKQLIHYIIEQNIQILIGKNGSTNFKDFDKYSKGFVDGMNAIWNELQKEIQ